MTGLEILSELAVLAQATGHAVPSPCISICRVDGDTGLCQGCFRTLDEIARWGLSSEYEKRVTWSLVAQRAGLNLS